jgi:hypothetical protein
MGAGIYFKVLQGRISLQLSALISFVVNITVSSDGSRRGLLVNWTFEGWGSFNSNILYSHTSLKLSSIVGL